MDATVKNTGEGFLQVRVWAGEEAIPIPDARVFVFGSDRAEEGTGVLYSLRTDADGKTPVVPLLTPPAAESMTPGYPAPFGRYNVTVQKEGYGTVENVGVPVFDGIVSNQPVRLVPLSEFQTDAEGVRRVYESPSGENPLL